jgi:hypothetical protein
MSKKSQIVIFFILGFIIMAIFYLLYSLRHETVTQKMEKEVTTASIDELKLQEIESYVQSCIDKTLSQSVDTIMLQGGNIFHYQEGSLFTSKIPYVEFNGANVSYQLFKPLFYPQDTLETPPIYPCHASDPLCQMGTELGQEDIFCCGIDHNPSLWICRWSGDYCFYRYNHTQSEHFTLGVKGRQRLCTASFMLLGYSCTCPAPPCSTSIEAQLSRYLDVKIPKCLNFSMFKAYNITLGNRSANLTIGKEDVALDLILPININMIEYAPTKKEMRFKSKYPVRLLPMFTFIFGMGSVKGLIDYEITNLTFDIVKDGQRLANQYGHLSITKYDLPEFKSSVIVVNDTSLNGKSSVFQFAVEKRIPALDYISQNPFGSNDIFVMKGYEIKFKPVAYDPDEDELHYTYHGWKTDSPGVDGLTSEAVAGSPNYWELSDSYTDSTKCVVSADKGMQEHVCADIKTEDADIGVHKVTIEVRDEDGYRDWQTTRILVGDVYLPMIEEKTNHPEHKACRKDPASFVSYAAIKNQPFYLEGWCGSDPGREYTYIWSFSPDSSNLGDEFTETKSGCTSLIEVRFDSNTIVNLIVEDTETLIQTSAPNRAITVYNDKDWDDYCGDIAEPYRDCDDFDDTAHPFAPELCDGKDNDCDGLTDTADADFVNALCEKTVGVCSGKEHNILQCAAGAWQPCTAAEYGADFEDPEANCFDGLDNDCNGITDVGCSCMNGQTKSCGTDEGQCVAGIQTCISGAWGLCVGQVGPAIETCDGLDNDCDGSTDEGVLWVNKGQACTVGVGACQRSGVYICNSGNPSGATICSATPGTPTPEVCDGLNNDCDGSTDEGALWVNKGQVCAVGIGACQRSGVYICNSGNPSGPTICSATPGTPTPEICDGLDNDCDGSEGALWANKGQACTVGVGACQRSGVYICNSGNPSGATICSATPGTPTPEVCDGLNNDCDGSTDEGALWVNKGQACTVGIGACQRSGAYICNSGNPSGLTICSATPGTPTPEVCDDGIDSSCDGGDNTLSCCYSAGTGCTSHPQCCSGNCASCGWLCSKCA